MANCRWGSAGRLGITLGLTVCLGLSPRLAHAGRARALALGTAVTCGTTQGAALWCWGRNNAGQLGDGTTIEQHRPKQVRGTTPLTYTRDDTTCVVTLAGRAACAGANNFGQIGDGTNIERHLFTVVGPHPELGGNVQTFTAGNTPCYVNHGIFCWGLNQFGAVGDGTMVDRALPVPVAADLVPASLGLESSGADGQTCVVVAGASAGNGTLWCWGKRAGMDPTASPAMDVAPTQLGAAGANVSTGQGALGVGVDHICVVKADHTLWCWGQNQHGQLGDGTTTARSTPVQVVALADKVQVVAVSPTGEFTCALTSSFQQPGGSFCWGRNDRGQLGDGTTTDRHLPTPVAVATPSMGEIAAGRDHACVFQYEGDSFWCWGANDHGQVGDGTTVDRPTPVFIRLAAAPPPSVPATSGGTIAMLALAILGVAGTKLGRSQRR